MGWLAGYDYRALIPIDDTGGALSDFQKVLAVVQGVGNNVADTIYLNNHALNWPLDVRFTEDDGETPVRFWREEYDATDGTWWVKLPTTPASGSTDYYIYYGKSDDSDASSGDNTFDFFDDFSGDLSKWTNNIGARASINSGNLLIGASSTGFHLNDIYTVVTADPRTHRIDWKALQGAGSNGVYPFGWRIDGTSDNRIFTYQPSNYRPTETAIWITSGGVSSTGVSSPQMDANWHDFSMWVDGTTGHCMIDDIDYNETDEKYDDFNSGNVGLSSWEGKAYLRLDNIRVRKYTSPEPAWDTPGSETTALTSYNSINRGMAVFA